MTFPRSAGVLLHPTSLPSRHGVGDLGPHARHFVEWLVAAGQSVWQVLPLGPTGYGDSPYQSYSAFAGNTLLVSLEDLVQDRWLNAAELSGPELLMHGSCQYAAAAEFKAPRLRQAYDRFARDASTEQQAGFQRFCTRHADWLDDYALFRACKAEHGERPWTEWDPAIAGRSSHALAQWAQRCAGAMAVEKFAQWQFHVQWQRLRDTCTHAGIRVMGDIPLFIAHDSADVWAHSRLFRLRANGLPEVVAGVPPDYFSATGQRWGNPLYRWDVMRSDNYAWWVQRFRHTLELVDWVRVDHFRGFEACWEIPASDATAVNGRWVKGPGINLFNAVTAELGALPIAAENLGLITPEVEAMRAALDYPGMAILQFAFGDDAHASDFAPHNYERNLVAYTGSHDNDTTKGWWEAKQVADGTHTAAQVATERQRVLDYLNSNGAEVHWDMMHALLASVANVAIVPLQDVLGLGTHARMNLPARASGNWGWRYDPATLSYELGQRLRALTALFGRLPSQQHGRDGTTTP